MTAITVDRSMSAFQGERGVIKYSALPTGNGMTDFTIRWEPGLSVVRCGGVVIVLLMTTHTVCG